ncbi:LysR family transcriptional regulator [Acuticoccus sp. I52.16.1]|uniref:LysR family transcriptional regulator n=1 Tax=Acuticoccus sp. I52.16.1 TaxID=2928472 RepID=UPI001FD4C98C|nr:LysR family transcriptional regulator [Acuticoccus sp. I52.16.1]UOM36062.1 LysR family transcriptional regulator [Acuticoccus sp. I52.16.1]
MSLTSSKIRALNAVVEEGGFTAAARRLGVSQPAVTQHVRELQTEFKVALFEKRRGSIVPTAICRELYRITSDIRRREDDALRLLARHDEMDFGPLRIGIGNAMPAMRYISAFRARHPTVALNIETGPWSRLMEAVLTQHIDVAIIPEVPDEPRFTRVMCSSQSVVALVHPDHAFADREEIEIAELVEQPLIFRTKQSYVQRVVDAAFTAAMLEPHASVVVDTRDSMLEAVANNLGVGFVWNNGSSRTESIRRVKVREMDKPWDEYAFHLAHSAPTIAHRFLAVVNETSLPG